MPLRISPHDDVTGVAVSASLWTNADDRLALDPLFRVEGGNGVVQPGDSLWTVAERLAPDDDPRPVVDALSSVRHGTVLTPGETISWDG